MQVKKKSIILDAGGPKEMIIEPTYIVTDAEFKSRVVQDCVIH